MNPIVCDDCLQPYTDNFLELAESSRGIAFPIYHCKQMREKSAAEFKKDIDDMVRRNHEITLAMIKSGMFNGDK